MVVVGVVVAGKEIGTFPKGASSAHGVGERVGTSGGQGTPK